MPRPNRNPVPKGCLTPPRRVTMATVSRPAGRPRGRPRDADLLRLLRAGEPAAVAQLYAHLAVPAFALARRLVGEEPAAEQVVRSAFVALWRDPGVVGAARSSVSAVLLGLVHQHAVEAIRNGSARRPPPFASDGPRPAASHRAPTADPGQLAVGERVRLALALLPSTQRQALTLAYFGGYTQREVAALTGVPLSTVRSQMLAGMRRLQEELPDDGQHARGGPRGAATAEGRGR